MEGFYVISWCVWTVWLTTVFCAGVLSLQNFRRATTPKQKRAAKALLIITVAQTVQLVVTASVPLPPDPVQLWRVFAGRGAAMAIAVTTGWVALYYSTEMFEARIKARHDKILRVRDEE